MPAAQAAVANFAWAVVAVAMEMTRGVIRDVVANFVWTVPVIAMEMILVLICASADSVQRIHAIAGEKGAGCDLSKEDGGGSLFFGARSWRHFPGKRGLSSSRKSITLLLPLVLDSADLFGCDSGRVAVIAFLTGKGRRTDVRDVRAAQIVWNYALRTGPG